MPETGALLFVFFVLVNLGARIASESEKAFARGLDVSQATSTNTFLCYRNNGYSTAFIRIYMPDGYGQVDPNGPTNMLNANSAGLGLEVYIVPQAMNTAKYCYEQLDEAYSYVTNSGLRISSVWLHVSDQTTWSTFPENNINFINNCLQRATVINLRMGIYTNAYDWQEITGGWTGHSSANLWYWDYHGSHAEGGSSLCNFNDFFPFGGWSNALVKQYAKNVYLCNSYVNLDCYVLGKDALRKRNSQHQPAVGTILLS